MQDCFPPLCLSTCSAHSAQVHPTSCSEKLRDFFQQVLRPRGIALTCYLADVYKAARREGRGREQLDREVSVTAL